MTPPNAAAWEAANERLHTALFNECVEKGRLIDERDALTARVEALEATIKKHGCMVHHTMWRSELNGYFCDDLYAALAPPSSHESQV